MYDRRLDLFSDAIGGLDNIETVREFYNSLWNMIDTSSCPEHLWDDLYQRLMEWIGDECTYDGKRDRYIDPCGESFIPPKPRILMWQDTEQNEPLADVGD